MEKINLSVERTFSDLITATVNFVKQEFRPFFKGFSIIVLPLLLVGAFLSYWSIQNVLKVEQASMAMTEMEQVVLQLAEAGFTVLLMLWVGLYTLAYLRVYREHYLAGNEVPITPSEVWCVMIRKFGIWLVFWLTYILCVILGLLLLIIPGIYLSVAGSMACYFMLMKDESLDRSIGASFRMIKGRWWYTLGFSVVLQLLVGVVSSCFQMPMAVCSITPMLTGELPNSYLLAFFTLLATLAKFALQVVSFIGAGMLFFSYLEQEEHTTLLNRIAEVGTETAEQDEERV